MISSVLVFLFTDETVFILTHKFSGLCSFPSRWWGRGVNNHCVGAWLLAGVNSQEKYREQMVFSEVSKWAVVSSLLCVQSIGAEVTWSLLVTEFGLCSSFAKFRWSESYSS